MLRNIERDDKKAKRSEVENNPFFLPPEVVLQIMSNLSHTDRGSLYRTAGFFNGFKRYFPLTDDQKIQITFAKYKQKYEALLSNFRRAMQRNSALTPNDTKILKSILDLHNKWVNDIIDKLRNNANIEPELDTIFVMADVVTRLERLSEPDVEEYDLPEQELTALIAYRQQQVTVYYAEFARLNDELFSKLELILNGMFAPKAPAPLEP